MIYLSSLVFTSLINIMGINIAPAAQVFESVKVETGC